MKVRCLPEGVRCRYEGALFRSERALSRAEKTLSQFRLALPLFERIIGTKLKKTALEQKLAPGLARCLKMLEGFMLVPADLLRCGGRLEPGFWMSLCWAHHDPGGRRALKHQ